MSLHGEGFSMREISDKTIKEFLQSQLDDVEDFGYLLIPDDGRLNDEALCNIKSKFKAFCRMDEKL